MAQNCPNHLVHDSSCKLCISVYNHAKYLANKPHIIEKISLYKKNHQDWLSNYRKQDWIKNKEKYIVQKKEYRAVNAEHIKKTKKVHAARLREAAVKHYSDGTMACALCGTKEYQHLCLDHKDGDGTRHRKENHIEGKAVYQWCKKNGYPALFRVLCYNCNFLEFLRMNPPQNTKKHRYDQKLKMSILQHYSQPTLKCMTCTCVNPQILTIDHINGNGKKHLMSINKKGGQSFYKWLRDNSFPPGFRVLCFNHNCSK